MSNYKDLQHKGFITLGRTANTSSGIYSADGRRLLRTLWSGEKKGKGKQPFSWDYTGDNRVHLPAGTYKQKVQSDNITYEHVATLANTSKYVDKNVWCGDNVADFTIVNGRIFVAQFYGEGRPSTKYAQLDNIQESLMYEAFGINPSFARWNCNDGTLAYTLGINPHGSNWFIWASNVETLQYHTFPNGAFFKMPSVNGVTYSGIDTGFSDGQHGETVIDVPQGVATIAGIDYIYVPAGGQRLYKFHKNGTPMGSQNIPGIQLIEFKDTTHCYITYLDGAVYKIALSSVGADGTILFNAVADVVRTLDYTPLALSYSNGILGVASNKHQFVKYRTIDHTLIEKVFEEDGYAASSLASYNKVLFYNSLMYGGITYTAVQMLPDGSFWVHDTGNNRLIHFSDKNEFIEEIAYLQANQSCEFHQTDSTRAFAQFCEYEVDLKNAKWKLKRNFHRHIPGNYAYDSRRKIYNITDIAGRTFALVTNGYTCQRVEISNTGARFTGEEFNRFWTQDANGDIVHFDFNANYVVEGKPMKWYRSNCKGLNGSGNPVMAVDELELTTPPLKWEDALIESTYNDQTNQYKTESGVRLLFLNRAYLLYGAGLTYNHTGYHLQGFDETGLRFSTCPSTKGGYLDKYVTDHHFDINAHNLASSMVAKKNHIIWHYPGEFWQDGQCNKIHHFSDIGLLYSVFGEVNGTDDPNTIRFKPDRPHKKGFDGNAASCAFTIVGDTGYYLQPGESYHGGLMLWHMKGLDTIQVQEYTITVPALSGLTLETYDTGSLTPAYKKEVLLVDNINGALAYSSLKSTAVSCRFSGCLFPKYNEETTLSITTKGKVRIWLNKSTLLLDGWNNIGLSTLTATTGLSKAGHIIEVEYAGTKAEQIVLKWSSVSLPSEIIPVECFKPNFGIDADLNKTHLTEGMHPYVGNVQNEMYGITRVPATDRNESGDSVSTYTGRHSVNIFVPQGLFIRSVIDNGRTPAARRLRIDLGDNDLTAWSFIDKLDLHLMGFTFDANQAAFNILDAQERIIATIQNRPLSNARTYFNRVQMGPKVENFFLASNCLISIVCVNGRLYAQIGSKDYISENLYSGVNDTPYDALADWKKPKYIEVFSLNSANHSVGFFDPVFSRDTYNVTIVNENDPENTPHPTGPDGAIQINNAGKFGHFTKLLLNKTKKLLGWGTDVPAAKLDVVKEAADDSGTTAAFRSVNVDRKANDVILDNLNTFSAANRLLFQRNGQSRYVFGNDIAGDGGQSFYLYDAVNNNYVFIVYADGSMSFNGSSHSFGKNAFINTSASFNDPRVVMHTGTQPLGAGVEEALQVITQDRMFLTRLHYIFNSRRFFDTRVLEEMVLFLAVANRDTGETAPLQMMQKSWKLRTGANTGHNYDAYNRIEVDEAGNMVLHADQAGASLRIATGQGVAGSHLERNAAGKVSWESILTLPEVTTEPDIPTSGAIFYSLLGNVWIARSNGIRTNLTPET